MSTPDGRYHLAFNGEIYNYVELREELASKGHRFVSTSDTEVLLSAIVEWGDAALLRLIGMFAFALLDTDRREVTLARDPFGIKPLFVSSSGDRLAFASEIPALLRFSERRATVDPQSIYDYLRHGLVDHGTASFFAGIEHIPPGHVGRCPVDDPRAFRIRPYWEPPADEPRRVAFPDAVASVRDAFLQNVSLHLRSDVPVGVALSGGVDSSAIACAIRHIGGPSVELLTFSYLAGERELDEEPWIDEVAEIAGAHQHKVRASAAELVDDLEELIRVQGEPFGSTSIYAQYRVFGLARDAGVKVMLDGQGADELLAGYRPYLGSRVASLVRDGRLGEAARLLRATSSLPDGRAPWKTAARGVAALVPERAATLARRRLTAATSPAWLHQGWFTDRGVAPSGGRGAPRRLSAALRDAVRHTSLPSLLRYEDRNSMAHSIESRVPFLTADFAELVLTLPEEHVLASDATSKAVFRAAMRGIVPDAVLDRRDKIGFATPEAAWLRSVRPWVDGVLASETAARLPFLDLASVRGTASRMLDGSVPFNWTLWRWINVIRWADVFDVEAA